LVLFVGGIMVICSLKPPFFLICCLLFLGWGAGGRL
jgi:hypothetical protein